MKTVPIKEARAALSRLVDLAQRGETVVITRNGREAARLCPMPAEPASLPPMADFRNTITRPATGLSDTVLHARNAERF
jgi:prevent-host-death family protein